MANPFSSPKRPRDGDVKHEYKRIRKSNAHTSESNDCKSQTKIVDRTSSRLQHFQDEPLSDNIDYLSLRSALDVLRSRSESIKREIKELNRVKTSIRETTDIKQISHFIYNNSDYLSEINYKGCVVKSPIIDWERNVGLDISKLNQSKDESYNCLNKINDGYEIIKRDKLFE